MSKAAKDSAADRATALRLCPSLAAVVGELETYEALLRRWQPKINLVSGSTLPEIWTRHFADSAQALEAFPQIATWADLGSGAGFPGMVTAILLKRTPGAMVHLIESDQRKAAFLRAVSRETGAPAQIHNGRIEEELPKLLGQVDGISARALAPLPQLIDWSLAHLHRGAVGVFLKGEDWRSELTALDPVVRVKTSAIASRTTPRARLIVAVGDFTQ